MRKRDRLGVASVLPSSSTAAAAAQLNLFMNPPDANRRVRTHVSGHGTDQDGQAIGGGFSGGSNTRECAATIGRLTRIESARTWDTESEEVMPKAALQAARHAATESAPSGQHGQSPESAAHAGHVHHAVRKARHPHANRPPTRSPMAQQRSTAPQPALESRCASSVSRG